MRHIIPSLVVFAVLILLTPRSGYAVTEDVLERAIVRYFPSAPEMAAVARCESGLRQYGPDGKVLRGGLGGHMLGLFQFNELYHVAPARALGYDLSSLLGNLAYARVVWSTQGTTPWNSSRSCWAPAIVSGAATSSASSDVTKVLRYGMRDPQVVALKTALVHAGYLIVSDDTNTDYFDAMTFRSLVRFQCDHRIACLTGEVSRAGIGMTGTSTRAALASAQVDK